MSLADLAVDGDMKVFLTRLAKWDGICSPKDLDLPADRSQDKARQKCKRRGWVSFADGYWRLTDSGRDLAQRLSR